MSQDDRTGPSYRRAFLAAGLGMLVAGPAFAQGHGRGNGGDGSPGRGGGDDTGRQDNRGGDNRGGDNRGGDDRHGNDRRGQDDRRDHRPQPRHVDRRPDFRHDDGDRIRDWRRENHGWEPERLPPGRRYSFERGHYFPRGAPRRPLPPGLARRLPQYPGYTYYAVGPDVVLVAIATGIVASVLLGALYE